MSSRGKSGGTRGLSKAKQLAALQGEHATLQAAHAKLQAEHAALQAQVAGKAKAATSTRQTAAQKRTAQAAVPPLVPIRTDLGMREIDPFAPPDPAFLTQVYGSHQLDRALQEYTIDILKRTADVVQAAHPGTKPTSRAKKQSIIEYIVQHS